MMKKLALVALLLSACSDSDVARSALLGQGFTDIEITGWAPLGCSDSDGTCTGFVALGPTGRRVSGVVGCGYFFKGCTVRTK